MNDEQITELINQITRIADVLELIQSCDHGSLSGIEEGLWHIDLAIRGKEDSE